MANSKQLQDLTAISTVLADDVLPLARGSNDLSKITVLDLLAVLGRRVLSGVVANDTSTAVQTANVAAINAANILGKNYILPLGRVSCNASIVVPPGSINFSITGQGGQSLSTGTGGTMLCFTGTGARFIDMRNTKGIIWNDVAFGYNNLAFTGIVVDLSCTGFVTWNSHQFNRCEWIRPNASAYADYTAEAGVYGYRCAGVDFQRCRFAHCQTGIIGSRTADVDDTEAPYFTFWGCDWVACPTSAADNPGAFWNFTACAFEPGNYNPGTGLYSVCKIRSTVATKVIKNLSFAGCLFSDATEPGTWIDLGTVYGFDMSGGSFAGLGVKAFRFQGQSYGVNVNGVDFDFLAYIAEWQDDAFAVNFSANVFLNDGAQPMIATYTGADYLDPWSNLGGNTPAYLGRGSDPARVRVLYQATVNMNSTADQVLTQVSNHTLYNISYIRVDEASVNMTTAAGGVYLSALKANVIVPATQVYTDLNTAARGVDLTLNAAGKGTITAGTRATPVPLYFSLTTPQGAAATARVTVYGEVKS